MNTKTLEIDDLRDYIEGFDHRQLCYAFFKTAADIFKRCDSSDKEIDSLMRDAHIFRDRYFKRLMRDRSWLVLGAEDLAGILTSFCVAAVQVSDLYEYAYIVNDLMEANPWLDNLITKAIRMRDITPTADEFDECEEAIQI